MFRGQMWGEDEQSVWLRGGSSDGLLTPRGTGVRHYQSANATWEEGPALRDIPARCRMLYLQRLPLNARKQKLKRPHM